MPLYEARSFQGTRNHSLTQEQKAEALAAVFGLNAHDGHPNGLCAYRAEPATSVMDTPQLSPEQIEQMRAILAAHDANNPREGIQSFDLNNPPKKPYVYKEFPRCLYHHKRGVTRNAHNQDELEAMLEQGYSKEPLPSEPAEPEAPEEAEAAEIAQLDALARKPKAKK